MAPPQFSNLGKKTKDLFKKTYDFRNEVKVTSKASGVKLENGGALGKSVNGYTKANWKDQYLGDVEVEAHSSGVAKAQFKLCKVTDGVDLTVAGAACGGVSVEAAYVQDFVSANAQVCHNLNKSTTCVVASAVFGFEGISIGGVVALDASGSPKDYNVGAEYAQKDLIASIVTSKKCEDINISVFHNVCPAMQLGASMAVQPEKSARTYTFGTEYKLDKTTTVKAKATSEGIVGTSVTHNLASPAMKVQLSSEYNVLSDDVFKAQKFGVAVNLGEY